MLKPAFMMWVRCICACHGCEAVKCGDSQSGVEIGNGADVDERACVQLAAHTTLFSWAGYHNNQSL
jgi:hypothetical protein